jgi:hypothetical protein
MTPINRRALLLAGATLPVLGMGGGCAIDPVKVQDAIKTACGIAVTAATIAAIVGLDPTMSISAIVSLICSGYQTAKSAGKLGAEPTKGTTVHFVVYVNGKPVDVEATVQ